jgi:hypothetical protein
MSPQSMALAYRIWAYASPRGWNVTAHEVADALNVSWQRVNRIAQIKGWQGRFRKAELSHEYMRAMAGGIMPGLQPDEIVSGRVGMAVL